MTYPERLKHLEINSEVEGPYVIREAHIVTILDSYPIRMISWHP